MICVYCFGPVFYEANEPSSTCRLRFKLQVEASTPPSIWNDNIVAEGRHGNITRPVWTHPKTHRTIARMLHPRWNFRGRARELSDGNAVVLSIPKSGRAWVRTFVSAYFSRTTGQPFSIEITNSRSRRGLLRIIYSHDRFEQRTKANVWERLRGKYLVPRAPLLRASVILLARDPRDALVSYFAQLYWRHPATVETLKITTADSLPLSF